VAIVEGRGGLGGRGRRRGVHCWRVTVFPGGCFWSVFLLPTVRGRRLRPGKDSPDLECAARAVRREASAAGMWALLRPSSPLFSGNLSGVFFPHRGKRLRPGAPRQTPPLRGAFFSFLPPLEKRGEKERPPSTTPTKSRRAREKKARRGGEEERRGEGKQREGEEERRTGRGEPREKRAGGEEEGRGEGGRRRRRRRGEEHEPKSR
jgi:hypothetical protein